MSPRALLLAAALAAAGAPPAQAAEPPRQVLVAPITDSASGPVTADKTNLGRAAAFWGRASRGRVSIAYTYAPPTALSPAASRLCAGGNPYDRLARVALSRPTARGRSFWAVVIVVPPSACLPTSTFTLTSAGQRVVLLSAPLLSWEWSTAAHEIGHSLGLGHSHSAALTAPGEQPAYLSEYGDSWSVMGNSGSLAAPPAPMQYALRWLRYRPIAKGQSLPLKPLSSGDALVWERGLGSRLWVELRDDGPAPGVMVHVETGAQAGYARSWLVTPAPLRPGDSWADPFTGAVLEVSAGSVSLR